MFLDFFLNLPLEIGAEFFQFLDFPLFDIEILFNLDLLLHQYVIFFILLNDVFIHGLFVFFSFRLQLVGNGFKSPTEVLNLAPEALNFVLILAELAVGLSGLLRLPVLTTLLVFFKLLERFFLFALDTVLDLLELALEFFVLVGAVCGFLVLADDGVGLRLG